MNASAAVFHDTDTRHILVTGARGFLGRAVVQALRAHGAGVSTERVELLHQGVVPLQHLLARRCPDAVVHLAYPGSPYGIATSVETPFTLAAHLLQMDLHVITACAEHRVRKLLCMGSACAYPEITPLPTEESAFWEGYPEPVNAAYGVAKRTQLMLLQAARQEQGLHGIHLVDANMYGPGDTTGHVIPALITRMRIAQRDQTPLVVWGEPWVTRSFLYVEDAAEGVCRALAYYDAPEPLNLASPEEVAMGYLVEALGHLLDFHGEVTWDPTKPVGHRRRCLSTTAMQAALHWLPPTPFAEGLVRTVAWHLDAVPLPTREEA